MTAYTSSPEAIREYMTAKERTEWWIRHHPSAEQYSPSAPPSDRDDLEEDGQSYTVYDSDAESTHSVPPKMLLKYGDGRPDIPISHWYHDEDPHHGSKRENDGAQSRTPPHQSHRRGRSDQLMRPAGLHMDATSAPYPEEIRVLPSQSTATPKSATSQDRRRAKSQPRHGYSPPHEPAPPLPRYPSQHTPTLHTIYTPTPRPMHPTTFLPPAPQVAYSQSHPMYHGRNAYTSRQSENILHRNISPPSIAYASRHSKNNYAPPTMIHHQHGAPGLTFSQSAPLPRHPQAPFQGGLTSVDEEILATRSKNGSRGLARMPMAQAGAHPRRSHSPSPSEESSSTYYMVPSQSQGHKVQIIPPDRSLYTATSTTQSPSPPHSSTSKKPFFSRFFNIAEKLASVDHSRSSSHGKRLQRRHSADASGRRRRSQS